MLGRFSVPLVMALMVSVIMGLSVPVRADDPDFLSLSVGAYDWNRQKDQGAEFRMEYRSDKKFFFFKPFVALSHTSTGSSFFGAGVLIDVFLGKRLVTTASFAPHYYTGSTAKLDLGHKIEFRSQLEIAYRFDDRSRLGVAVSHYSNASLGSSNPGTEVASLYYSIPFSKITGIFK